MKEGISVCIILYNDGEYARKTFESIKNIANEIIVVHDGPCKNNTLDICKKYTNQIYVRPWKGMCEYHQAFAYRKAKYKWILKLDSDEYLSKSLQQNIREIIKNKEIDKYTFICPYWNGKEYITKTWPHKGVLYRKSKISYFGFTNWGEPQMMKGKTIRTDYLLHHKPQRGLATNWKTYWNRSINNSAFFQAKDTLKDFKKFENFQYKQNDFPLQIKIRRKFPLASAIPIAIYSMYLDITNPTGWKESPLIRFKLMFFNATKYIFLGYYIYKLKKNPNFKPR